MVRSDTPLLAAGMFILNSTLPESSKVRRGLAMGGRFISPVSLNHPFDATDGIGEDTDDLLVTDWRETEKARSLRIRATTHPNPIRKQGVQVDVKVERAAKALDHRQRARSYVSLSVYFKRSPFLPSKHRA